MLASAIGKKLCLLFYCIDYFIHFIAYVILEESFVMNLSPKISYAEHLGFIRMTYAVQEKYTKTLF